MRQAILRNAITGATVKVYATTESSYCERGKAVWVDEFFTPYGEVDNPAFGYEVVFPPWETKQ
jgi:hypothetical protein